MSEDVDNFMPYLENAASKCCSVLELGPGKGTGSTLAFSRGLSSSECPWPVMVSVDRLDYMEEKPEAAWWTLVIGDSMTHATVAKVCLILENPPDIIFIDTVHTPAQVTAELNLWQEMAGDHTTWLFHDTYMMGERNPMIDAIQQFAAENGWIYEDVFTEAHGLGRMRREVV